MELGNTIKTLRQNMGLSQEELADAVYVTRQTVSNWENGKSYPDVKSLLLLGSFFGVSLDILVKGDVEKMREISQKEIKRFKKYGTVLTALFLLELFAPIPLAKFLGWWGIAVYIAVVGITLWFAFRVERFKKEQNISTYREIEAFMEGKRLDEASALREEGKRPYQRALMAVIGAAAAVAVCAIMWLLLR